MSETSACPLVERFVWTWSDFDGGFFHGSKYISNMMTVSFIHCDAYGRFAARQNGTFLDFQILNVVAGRRNGRGKVKVARG